MGDIIESRRRHYVGADADKDTIPAAGKARGDSFHGNDSKKQYYWNGTAWKTGLGYEYVERRVGAVDFTGGNPTGAGVDFQTDNNWQVDGLDLTGIVPVGAKAVLIRMIVTHSVANTYFILRVNATDVVNQMQINTPAAGVGQQFVSILAIDANRLLDYRGSNVTFDTLQVAVVGWFI